MCPYTPVCPKGRPQGRPDGLCTGRKAFARAYAHHTSFTQPSAAVVALATSSLRPHHRKHACEACGGCVVFGTVVLGATKACVLGVCRSRFSCLHYHVSPFVFTSCVAPRCGLTNRSTCAFMCDTASLVWSPAGAFCLCGRTWCLTRCCFPLSINWTNSICDFV